MNQELELELTYLVKRIPEEIKNVQPVRIVDIYIPETAIHPHLRLRQKGEKCEITKKIPVSEGDASEQVETTIVLTKEEFLELAKNSSRKVVKDRYKVKIDKKDAEVDIFLDKLEGLVLVDFEFETIEEKASFAMPDFCLADVTQEEFIAGGMLAGKSYENISRDLQRFGYYKIAQDEWHKKN